MEPQIDADERGLEEKQDTFTRTPYCVLAMLFSYLRSSAFIRGKTHGIVRL
jgi:hypothetical protein